MHRSMKTEELRGQSVLEAWDILISDIPEKAAEAWG